MKDMPDTGTANDLIAVAAQYAHAARNALRADDLAGHIASIPSTLAAAEVVGSVRDHLLLQKMAIFLRALASLPASDRQSMAQRLAAEPAFNQELGEHIIELLDRLEGRRKPAMVGAVFSAYAFAQIDAKTLRRLNAAIAHLPVIEIDAIRAMESADGAGARSDIDPISVQAVANAGMATAEIVADGLDYELNEIGRRFLELELDRVRPQEP